MVTLMQVSVAVMETVLTGRLFAVSLAIVRKVAIKKVVERMGEVIVKKEMGEMEMVEGRLIIIKDPRGEMEME